MWLDQGTHDLPLSSWIDDAFLLQTAMVNWLSRSIQRIGVTGVLIGLLATPSVAKDPFRTTNQRPIDDRTEAVFRAAFERGDYKTAQNLLPQTPTTEPLANALRAALAYQQGDLNSLSTYATRTRESAAQLVRTDPLRGNIYQATGSFLEGAYIVSAQGMVSGIPQALGKLQDAFRFLDAAEKIAPQDPELNLIKGLIDLNLAANVRLPLSSPDDAIQRLERYAGPRYLADFGLALGYRDLKQYDRALQAINRALQAAPDNPQFNYAKAQILVRQGQRAQSVPLFQKALNKKDQLPPTLVNAIQRELRLAQQPR